MCKACEILKRALSFYADINNYKLDTCANWPPRILPDQGFTARFALNELEAYNERLDSMDNDNTNPDRIDNKNCQLDIGCHEKIQKTKTSKSCRKGGRKEKY